MLGSQREDPVLGGSGRRLTNCCCCLWVSRGQGLGPPNKNIKILIILQHTYIYNQSILIINILDLLLICTRVRAVKPVNLTKKCFTKY